MQNNNTSRKRNTPRPAPSRNTARQGGKGSTGRGATGKGRQAASDKNYERRASGSGWYFSDKQYKKKNTPVRQPR